MRCELEPRQAGLVAEVDEALDALGPDAGVRESFKALGTARLLAVHYPAEYGGRGLTVADHATVSERMGLRGLPDVAHLITVQGVGCPILTFGTDAQRRHWLPEITSGRLLASLLLSEYGAGSDLTRITTSAMADGGGWRISGRKTWSLLTEWSQIALCSVRTRQGNSRYDGISLFLVDLNDPGVRINPMPRAAGEPYNEVTLDDVRVSGDALVGELHKGWALLPTVIGFERGGFDYLTRAQSWLAAAAAELGALPCAEQEALAADFARCEFLVDNARALAYHAVATAEGLETNEIVTAYAKLASGMAAQAVTRWAGEELLSVSDGEDGPHRRLLRAAVVEAPELTVSGGAQELQLDLIAEERLIGRTIR
ncbi:acyl-CoA dehydrogenase family protein [Streptomyces sp. NPDC093097]|uniref:acyl-CoA dehydrogenase family protein n=1 Tax=Streptomyces sp. NPDC093097 TaxID=3366027 RepID=UPI00380F1AC0